MTPVLIGITDRSVLFFIPDPASTDGSGKTGLNAAALTVSYTRVETDNDVVVTDATSSLNDLSALTDAHNDWGVKEVSSTLAPGLYRLDIADAVFASGAWYAVVYVMITSSAAAASPMLFRLIAYNELDAAALGLTLVPANVTQFGGSNLTSASGIPEVKVASIANDAITAAAIAANAIGASEIADGAIDAGAIAADAITAAKIADGAIDAATFAAGAITAAAIAADAIGASELAADAVAEIQAAIAAGAVASVTGNVGGNVTGSVGSVAAGGITASSIAADAIGASELAADAAAEIGAAVWAQTLDGQAFSKHVEWISAATHGDCAITGSGPYTFEYKDIAGNVVISASCQDGQRTVTRS